MNERRVRFYLRERLLWWRCFAPVIFAHKPLCAHFGHHVIRFANIAICRSCGVLYAAFILGLGWQAMNPGLVVDYADVFAGLVALTVVVSFPGFHTRLPRWARDCSRAGLGVSLAWIVGLVLSHQWMLGLMAVSLLWLVKMSYARVRQFQHHSVCDRCPEFHDPRVSVCSGFREKYRRSKRYARVLNRWLRDDRSFDQSEGNPVNPVQSASCRCR
jgi:hypothetical protein